MVVKCQGAKRIGGNKAVFLSHQFTVRRHSVVVIVEAASIDRGVNEPVSDASIIIMQLVTFLAYSCQIYRQASRQTIKGMMQEGFAIHTRSPHPPHCTLFCTKIFEE